MIDKKNINTTSESIGYIEDSRDAEQAAREKFKEMDALNYKDSTPEYPGIRLIMSNHPYSEGWHIEWGETAKSMLSKYDTDVSEHARNNPSDNLFTAK